MRKTAAGNRRASDFPEAILKGVSNDELERLKAFRAPGDLSEVRSMELKVLRARRDTAWRNGDLSYLMAKRPFMRDHYYRRIHEFKKLHPLGHGPLVVVASRRVGKSTGGGLYLWERAIQKPDTHVLFLAPTSEQCKDIVRPICNWILRDCPDDIQVKTTYNHFYIRNSAWGPTKALSSFSYYGTDHFKGKSLRGIPSITAAFVDEAREADPDKYEYVIDSVIAPAFAGVEDPLLVLASTIPDDMAHPFVQRFVPTARDRGRLIVLPRSKNTDWTPDDDQKVGYHDAPQDVKDREYECLFKNSRKHSIIPEFEDCRSQVVLEHPRPKHYIPRVSIDGGFYPDPLAVLFYYVDFIEKLLVIEAEMFLERPTTSEFACELLDMELEVFGEKGDDGKLHPPSQPVRRIADMKNTELEDLRRDQALLQLLREKYNRHEGIYVAEVPFHQKGREAGLRALRANFFRIRIHPRCERLIFQLQTGTLDKKGDFTRSEKLGHCDAIACLRSAVRCVLWDENPYPQNRLPHRGEADSWTSPGYREPAPSTRMVITRNSTITRHDFGVTRLG